MTDNDSDDSVNGGSPQMPPNQQHRKEKKEFPVSPEDFVLHSCRTWIHCWQNAQKRTRSMFVRLIVEAEDESGMIVAVFSVCSASALLSSLYCFLCSSLETSHQRSSTHS